MRYGHRIVKEKFSEIGASRFSVERTFYHTAEMMVGGARHRYPKADEQVQSKFQP